MKRHITWFALVLVAIAASLAATGAASAGGATQVDGVQTLVSLGDLSDPADDVYWMAGYGAGRPALIGRWRTTSFQLGVFTPSGVVTGTGTEGFTAVATIRSRAAQAASPGPPAGSTSRTIRSTDAPTTPVTSRWVDERRCSGGRG